jgi:hypothetical protein
LPARITPFKVFFGQKPHWLTEPLLNVDNKPVDENRNLLAQEQDPDSDDEYQETNTEDNEYILIELERQIKQSNARTAA